MIEYVYCPISADVLTSCDGRTANALTDTLRADLGINQNAVNNGQSILLCMTVAGEIPSQLVQHRVGHFERSIHPRRRLTVLIVCFFQNLSLALTAGFPAKVSILIQFLRSDGLSN